MSGVKNSQEGKEDIENEVKITYSEIEDISNLINVSKSICKITYQIEENGKIQEIKGTGFLIKLEKQNKPFFCLMTNEHVITREIISSKNQIINVSYDNENKTIEINLKNEKNEERFIKEYTYIDIDATVVEILEKDNIKEEYFLLPNKNYINKYNELKNKEINILQFPGGKNLSRAKGKINSIKQYQLSHTASTLEGSSGGPIFLKEDDSLVIGIHNSGSQINEENYGYMIGPIIDSLKTNYFNGRYEGEFTYDDKFGLRAEGYGKLFYYENNTYYIGQFLKGLKHGKGVEYYANGKVLYDGEFKNGKYEGYGRRNYKDGKYYYEGPFLNGLFDWKGKIYYANGKVLYDGEFKNGKIEGYGRLNYEDGGYYEGHFFNYLKDGKGKEYDKNGKVIYDGEFKNGKYYNDHFFNVLKYGKEEEYPSKK